MLALFYYIHTCVEHRHTHTHTNRTRNVPNLNPIRSARGFAQQNLQAIKSCGYKIQNLITPFVHWSRNRNTFAKVELFVIAFSRMHSSCFAVRARWAFAMTLMMNTYVLHYTLWIGRKPSAELRMRKKKVYVSFVPMSVAETPALLAMH